MTTATDHNRLVITPTDIRYACKIPGEQDKIVMASVSESPLRYFAKRFGGIENCILPPNTCLIWRKHNKLYVMLEEPPQLRSVSWTNDKSPSGERETRGKYGKRKYTRRTLAFPWSYPTMVMTSDGSNFAKGNFRIAESHLFFADQQMVGGDATLFPATLLNIEKFSARICQPLNSPAFHEEGINKHGLTAAIQAVSSLFWGSDFNYDWDGASGDGHTAYSWMQRRDETPEWLKDVAQWEKRSKEDPAFILQEPLAEYAPFTWKLSDLCPSVKDKYGTVFSLKPSEIKNLRTNLLKEIQ